MTIHSYNKTLSQIECVCGKSIDTSSLEEAIVFDLLMKQDTNNIESNEDEYTCDCGRIYNLNLEYSLSVNLECYELNLSEPAVYKTVDNQEVDSVIFEGKTFGDIVPLPDGDYEHNNYIYKVVDQKILYISSSLTDENQLSLDFSEAALV